MSKSKREIFNRVAQIKDLANELYFSARMDSKAEQVAALISGRIADLFTYEELHDR